MAFNKQPKTKGYRRSKRGLTLVGKSGRINHKNIERFEQEILNNPNYDDNTKLTLINQERALVKARHQNERKLTTSGFFGVLEENKIEKLLTNAGYTAEELAEETGVSEKDILNPNNWNAGVFMGQWQLEFNYTGPILKKI